MKIRKISVIGVLIIVSLVVTGIAVVNSWKKSPYGTLHINAALLQKVIEFKNIDLFGENKTPMEIRKTTAESRGLLQKKPTPVYQVTNPANMNTDSYRQFAD